jgi:hypothetical protein
MFQMFFQQARFVALFWPQAEPPGVTVVDGWTTCATGDGIGLPAASLATTSREVNGHDR